MIVTSQNSPDTWERIAFYTKDERYRRYARARESGDLAAVMGDLSVGAGHLPNGCDDWVTSSRGAAHGRRIDPRTLRNAQPCDAPVCPIRPPQCDCHVIGANTLNTTGIPIASLAARFATLTIDSGDAAYFVPYYMFIAAFQVGGTPTTTITGPNVLVLLQDSRAGQEPNLRRASTSDPSFGIATNIYGDQKEIECVDWQKFASVNNQQLTMVFYNPQDFAVHVFVDLWGIAAA